MGFADLTQEQKEARYAYNRDRRERIKEAAIAGGYEPQERVVLSEEERADRRQMHQLRRRKTMTAIYAELRSQGLSPAEADEELEELAGQVEFHGPDHFHPFTSLGPNYFSEGNVAARGGSRREKKKRRRR